MCILILLSLTCIGLKPTLGVSIPVNRSELALRSCSGVAIFLKGKLLKLITPFALLTPQNNHSAPLLLSLLFVQVSTVTEWCKHNRLLLWMD